MTLGPVLALLAWFEGKQSKVLSLFQVYGRVPFFYYILHFYLIRILNVILFFALGFKSNQIRETDNIFLFRPASFGFELWSVYLIWLLIVAALYFPCIRFGEVKKKSNSPWLSYL
jgi:chromate transport protein ChrA